MSRRPMPSPRGTNYARLYIDSSLYRRDRNLIAMDSALPRPGGRMARDQEERDDNPMAGADFEQAIQVIRKMLDLLPEQDAKRLLRWMSNLNASWDPAMVAGQDSQIRARQQRRMAADGALPTRTFEEAFPNAAPIKVV